ncbi:MAG TPA: deoxyribonuclease IV [Clostridia bacterium]|nr:deoxyribonuclease IV [Clostridia bacterium]
MIRIGAHLTISGGLFKMAELARDLHCEAVQIFSRSPRGGKPREFTESEIMRMRQILDESDIRPLVVHVPYLVNLAHDGGKTRDYAREVLTLDLKRSDALGCAFCVVHSGHHEDEERGLANVASLLREVLEEYTPKCRLLLENTAGQGGEVGRRFSSLAAVISVLREEGFGDCLGICLDVCHAFAAGYDVRLPETWAAIGEELRGVTEEGLVYLLHLNDSQHPLGSRRDRHAHVGEGYIGVDGFGTILAVAPKSWFCVGEDIAGILETPIEIPGDYLKDMGILREIRGAG